MSTYSGIWPALITPFTAANAVHTDTIVRMINTHLAKGVGGFYLCGSTGSGVYLSVAERKHVVETALAAVQGRVPVIVHVGTVALPDAIELARHAQQHGAVGVSSTIPPLYPTVESIYAYFETLARTIDDLPFFPYIMQPQIDVLALVQHLLAVPNVRGSKYTGPNMYEFREIVTARADNWSVFSGMDEQSVFAAMSGSCGHIGSTINFMPGVYIAIRQHVLAGEHDQALALQRQANTITAVMYRARNFAGALYAMLAHLGFDCGEPRLPGSPLTADEKIHLLAELDAVGFDDVAALEVAVQ